MFDLRCGTGHGRNRKQRRSNFLSQEVQYHQRPIFDTRGQQPHWSSRRSSLSSLHSPRLLAYRSAQQPHRPSWNNLRLLCYRRHRFCMGSCSKFLGKPLHCPLRPRSRHRLQIHDRPCLCRRVFSRSHPRRSRNDVADVDRLWHHAWKYNGRSLLECRRRSQLAPHAWIHGCSSPHRLLPGLFLPGKPPLAHQEKSYLKSL